MLRFLLKMKWFRSWATMGCLPGSGRTPPLFVLAGTVVVLALILVPMYLAHEHLDTTRNFRVVREGVLYRSGQMTLDGLKRTIHERGIKTVINLRDGKTRVDQAEEKYCRSQEILFVRIPPLHWSAPVGEPPVQHGVRLFRAVMADPRNYPVLVHCFAGVHRTGAYCAIYRMEFEGWSNERAIAEMKACGYTNLENEKDILGYMLNYQPVGLGQHPTHGHR